MRAEEAHLAEIVDFTEAEYRKLLRGATINYRFVGFREAGPPRTILWRHDCDASMHRSLKLAEIEYEESVKSTYFLFPRCRYYNLLSPDTSVCVRKIIELGHDVGLHFDPTHYGEGCERRKLEAAIAMERRLLVDEFGQEPTAISFHLYGVLSHPMPDDDLIGGMVNAYSATLRRHYSYVSDSNGVWLYRRLKTVLEEVKDKRLQVLTHPEWWTPEAMPPRARLQRAIDGYASAMGRWYDEITAKHDRPNIR